METPRRWKVVKRAGGWLQPSVGLWVRAAPSGVSSESDRFAGGGRERGDAVAGAVGALIMPRKVLRTQGPRSFGFSFQAGRAGT